MHSEPARQVAREGLRWLAGAQGEPHTWKLHSYRGIGSIPKNLNANTDAAKRILRTRLPQILKGYGKTPGIDAVVVVLDADKRNCVEFLAELKAMTSKISPAPKTLFRLAIEEIEAWYLGDSKALKAAYPKAKQVVLDGYAQDTACGTWEVLADAIHPGGAKALNKATWPHSGQLKHEWAERIGPLLDPGRNASPSFNKLRDGLLRLIDGQH